MPYSDAGKDASLNGIAAAGTFISVHSADPGRTGASQSSTNRVATTWGANTGTGATRAKPGSQVGVAMPAGSSGSHFGVWTAASGGTFICGYPLSQTETFTGAGTLDVTPTLTAPDA